MFRSRYCITCTKVKESLPPDTPIIMRSPSAQAKQTVSQLSVYRLHSTEIRWQGPAVDVAPRIMPCSMTASWTFLRIALGGFINCHPGSPDTWRRAAASPLAGGGPARAWGKCGLAALPAFADALPTCGRDSGLGSGSGSKGCRRPLIAASSPCSLAISVSFSASKLPVLGDTVRLAECAWLRRLWNVQATAAVAVAVPATNANADRLRVFALVRPEDPLHMASIASTAVTEVADAAPRQKLDCGGQFLCQ